MKKTNFFIVGILTLISTNLMSQVLNIPLNPSQLIDDNGCVVTSSGIVVQPARWRFSNNLIFTNPCSPNAKVGINVQNPSERLEVMGNAVISGKTITNQLLVQGPSPTNGIAVSITNGDLLVKNRAIRFNDASTSIFADDFGLNIKSGNSLLKLDHNGRIGIGEYTPTAKLTIAGDPTGSNDFMRCTKNVPNQGIITEFRIKADGGFLATSASTVRVEAASDKAFSVFCAEIGGNVFTINGAGVIHATELIVDAAPFPDYVFDKNYQLMSLAKLEVYIDKFKHLPNVPSAKQVEDNGMQIGELVRVQQEKIEELTLYIIELNKQVEELEKANKR